MTQHVTVDRAPAGDRVVLRCARCGAGLVVDPPTEVVAGDSQRWFESEHRECVPPKGSR